MTSFTKFTELKNLGKLLYKLKCKWEKHVEENGARFREVWSGGITYTSTRTLFYRITLQHRINSKWYILVISNKYVTNIVTLYRQKPGAANHIHTNIPETQQISFI